MTAARRLLSVNVARPTPIEIDGRQVMTAIRKRAASSAAQPERLAVAPLGIDGDEQTDLTVHGGLSKAVYAYPHEHYKVWQTMRAQAGVQSWDDDLPFGMLGENLTITGLLESDVWVGDLLKFPDCTLAVSEPRQPCFKFQAVMGFKQASKMMAQSGYCGFYLAVREPGTIAAGDSFELIAGPREVSISELFANKMRRRDV
ncbi:MOSC domain-containing protein [Aquabacterium sp.]|uniref:MOSC domain-containing protein n=1 Tax=Aquabacterium sp. TaxID=1872578 RepID=UPI0035B07343